MSASTLASLAALALGASDVALETTTTGYVDSRMGYTHVVTGGPLPTESAATLANLTEGNVQLKLRFGERGYVAGDGSLFWQWGGGYYGADPATGAKVRLDARDVPAYRPSAVVSELFGAANFGEHANLTLGKKRVVWGPGLAQNPSDLVNPPKDPTDPSSQRAGAWLARLELPFERFTFSALAVGKVLRQYGGLPSALVYYPDHPSAEAAQGLVGDDRDGQPHFLSAARAYALLADTDLNAIWYFGNAYGDAFLHKHRFAATASHVFGALELHAEALAQTGSSRLYAEPGCVESAAAFGACARRGVLPAGRTRLDDGLLRPKVLAGARWQFEDSAMLTLEYAFNGEGYTAGEFADYVALLRTARAVSASNPEVGQHLSTLLQGGLTDPGAPQKFSFEPLRKHYVFASYTKPQIKDDFTFTLSVIANAQDLSGQAAPSLAWSAREWLSLSAVVYAPWPGLSDLGADVGGERYTEFGMLPLDVRAFVSARAWF